MTDILFGVKNFDELIAKVDSDRSIFDKLKIIENETRDLFNVAETSKSKSSVVDINIPLLFPYILNKNQNQNLNLNLNIIDEFNGKNIVVCGKILECITDKILIPDTYDIFIYADNIEYDKIKNLIMITNDESEYVIGTLKKSGSKVKLYKKIYMSVLDVLLNRNRYVERFGYDCKEKNLLGSASFYIELDRLCTNTDLVKINIHYNLMNARMLKYNILHKIVNAIDLDKFQKLDKKILEEYYETLDDDGLTPIERAICIHPNLTSPLLKKNLNDIIIVLSEFVYRRPPQLLICSDKDELADVISNIENKYNLSFSNFSERDIFKINTYVVQLLLKKNINDALDFMTYIDFKFMHDILFDGRDNNNNNNNNELKKILVTIIPKLGIERACRIILYSEMIDLFEDLSIKLNDDFVIKYISELIQHHKYISLLYLIKKGFNIFGFKYQIPLLHYMNMNMINDVKNLNLLILFKKYSDLNLLVNEIDNNGNNFAHFLAVHNPGFINLIVKLGVNMNIIQNSLGYTPLHILCVNKCFDVIKCNITLLKSVLNVQNKYGETPILISARNGDAKLFTLLKKHGASEKYSDHYGNTVFHYICINEMFQGTTIIETKNDYGYLPSDYTMFKKYWKFSKPYI